MNFFKRSVAAMSPLETALLASLKTEPNKWFFTGTNGADPSLIRCDNREKGVTMYLSSPESPRVHFGKLTFSEAFASAWASLALPEIQVRVEEDNKNEAARVEAQMRQRMGL